MAHRLINRSNRDAVYLEVGTRGQAERVHYPDVDLRDASATRTERRPLILAQQGSGEPLLMRRSIRRRRDRPWTNFKLDIDADGIALVTWDMPGRSMNVIDIDGDRGARPASSRRSQPMPPSRARSSPRARTPSAAAPISPCWSASARSSPTCAKSQGEEAAARCVFDESRKLSQLYRRLETCGKPWVARSTAPRWAAASSLRSPAITASPPTIRRPALGLPEIKIGLFPGAGGTQRVARMLPPADALQFLLKGDQLRLDRAKAMKLIDAVVPPADLVKAAKDWIKAGGKADGAVGREGLPAARRAGLFQGRHDDVPGGQRDLPARDLRQLSGRARDPAGGLRGPAAADGSGAARRVALVRQDPALAGSGGDDPLAVRLDAGAQQGRAPPDRRAGDQARRRSASSAPASWAPASPR